MANVVQYKLERMLHPPSPQQIGNDDSPQALWSDKLGDMEIVVVTSESSERRGEWKKRGRTYLLEEEDWDEEMRKEMEAMRELEKKAEELHSRLVENGEESVEESEEESEEEKRMRVKRA
ncbi:hypothetical protein QQ045_017652 [Rhodiola kirilowii]